MQQKTAKRLSLLEQLGELYDQQFEETLSGYYSFLRYPSVSAQLSHRSDCLQCAEWLRAHLQMMGFRTELWNTPTLPTLYAESMQSDPSLPTILFYNHYDVQPEDPLSCWESPPFDPTLRGGEVYARGAQDNKGQCWYVLTALKLLTQLWGSLPANIKLCIEGDEETGSHGLSSVAHAHAKELRADLLAVVDLGMQSEDEPAITLGLRGLVAVDITLRGPSRDLHSGSFGGMVYNPARALCELLASFFDANGAVAIPGFYDAVVEVEEEFLQKIDLSFDPQECVSAAGVFPTGGEQHLSPLVRNWLRPTLDINGIYSGYQGSGTKTVIPASATAKLTCRLVPNQEPKQIAALIEQAVQRRVPEGVTAEVTCHSGAGMPFRTEPTGRGVVALRSALETLFQKPCALLLSGASIPVVPSLAAVSGAELLLMGLGLPSDQIHSPNEHFSLQRLKQGSLAIAQLIATMQRKSQ